jgi:amidase
MSAAALPVPVGTIAESHNTSWQDIVKAKKARLETAIPSEWRLDKQLVAGLTRNDDVIGSQAVLKSGLLSAKEVELTETYTAKQLVAMMARQQVTAVQVVTAFCKRAAVAQQLVRATSSLQRCRIFTFQNGKDNHC